MLRLPTQDLYVYDRTNAGSLDEKAVAPIVKAMAIYFKLDQIDLDSTQRLTDAELELEMKVVSDLLFTGEDIRRGERFRLPREWGGFSVPVLFGTGANPIKIFKDRILKRNQQHGQGISPFTKFEIDFQQLNLDSKSVLSYFEKSLSEMILIFQVEHSHAIR